MLIHDYHSNNDDGLNWATLRTFSKNRPLLDNEHIYEARRPPRVGARRSRKRERLAPTPYMMHCDFLWRNLLLFFSSIDGDKACWKVIRCTEYNSMLSKQYGCIIIFLVDPSWWSSYMFEYYEARFKFTTAPLQLHYGRYVIQHCRPQNRRQFWVLEIYVAKNDEGPYCPR